MSYNAYSKVGPASRWVGFTCEQCGEPTTTGQRICARERGGLFEFYPDDQRFLVWHSTCTPEHLDRQWQRLVKHYRVTGSIFGA